MGATGKVGLTVSVVCVEQHADMTSVPGREDSCHGENTQESESGKVGTGDQRDAHGQGEGPRNGTETQPAPHRPGHTDELAIVDH